MTARPKLATPGSTERISMVYRVEIYCPDCCVYFYDPDGCFNGTYEPLLDTFETIEAAVTEGAEHARGYIVLDEAKKEVLRVEDGKVITV